MSEEKFGGRATHNVTGCVGKSVAGEVFETAASVVAGGRVILVRVDDSGSEVVEL